MIRTLISLSPDDKAWLDRAARRERVPMTRIVQKAIRLLRETSASDARGFDKLLGETAGIWKQGDGLDYQRGLRDEWGWTR